MTIKQQVVQALPVLRSMAAGWIPNSDKLSDELFIDLACKAVELQKKCSGKFWEIFANIV